MNILKVSLNAFIKKKSNQIGNAERSNVAQVLLMFDKGAGLSYDVLAPIDTVDIYRQKDTF